VNDAAKAMNHEESLNLFDIGFILWRDKWLVIGITAVCIVLSAAYAFYATPWYRAEVVLKLADNRQSQGLLSQLGGSLGGLASLAGFDMSENKSAEPIGVLKSREFAGAFIEEQNLLPLFFAKKWDAAAHRWKPSDAQDQPDIRDGIKYFENELFKVQEDKRTGLITISVQWTDAKTAAAWANLLVERVNDRMRQRALTEGEASMNFLKQELTTSNVVTLQQSIGRVLESELQKLMLAQANKEYAFRVIDHAQVPKWRDHPHRILIVVAASVFGCVISGLFLVSRHVIRRDRRLRRNMPFAPQ
jgi:uncharacterized protein involved in exopolysaccharide biosynthesis